MAFQTSAFETLICILLSLPPACSAGKNKSCFVTVSIYSFQEIIQKICFTLNKEFFSFVLRFFNGNIRYKPRLVPLELNICLLKSTAHFKVGFHMFDDIGYSFRKNCGIVCYSLCMCDRVHYRHNFRLSYTIV